MESTFRPLLIGPAPGPSFHGEPLSGRAGRRLSRLCGLSLPAYLKWFERINLFDKYPGAKEKGDDFDHVAARVAACQLTPVLRRRYTVLLGQNVARAFHMDGSPRFVWHDEIGDGALVAVCPHPSGISLWWNDERNVRRARTFWRDLVARTERPPPA